MCIKEPLIHNYQDWSKFIPNPPLLTSLQSGWNNIQLDHYCEPLLNVPETSNSWHMIMMPLGHKNIDFELILAGRLQTVSYSHTDFASHCIQLYPAELTHQFRARSSVQAIEWFQCYLEPTFLAQVAHESVNPTNVELVLTLKKADALVHQILLALKASLEVDGDGSRFYAESMATALSAHLLRHYSTGTYSLRQHEDGLSKPKLKQAIAYIEMHLGEDLSLSAIARELGMSQYYFCRLFKQSIGVAPHQYLIQQRVQRAKLLLKQPERTISSVAMECGFASQSHFAKCFRQHTGMNPKQFCKL